MRTESGTHEGRLELPDVTLVAASSVAMAATQGALEACLQQVSFARALCLTDRQKPGDLHPEIQWTAIAPLTSRADYSRFMLTSLVDYVSTSHVLCVQWDGYLLDADRWDPQFLEYDYIGAPWPHFADGHDVGNGGFSLRSRRLLEACRGLTSDANLPEDVLIGRVWRNELEAAGINYAPSDVARRFAFERTTRHHDEFGFHGIFNLVEIMSSSEALKILRSLEDRLLSPNERRELFLWAVGKGRGRIALELVRREIGARLGLSTRSGRGTSSE